jgi:phosphatidylserine/phosphatidylglycerophosphate/cardiolipin synthase-like enzyme
MCRAGWSLLLVVAGMVAGCQPPGIATLPAIEVYFSPHGGCTDAVVREIESARSTILVQAYSFTSSPIAKALVDARKRGVRVQAILDKSELKEGSYSEADFLAHVGVPTLIDAEHAIAHNKVIILDGQVVLTGSFNFTRQAETSNAENLLVIRSPALARQYTANWQLHAEHSERYTGRQPRGESSRREEGGHNSSHSGGHREKIPALPW